MPHNVLPVVQAGSTELFHTHCHRLSEQVGAGEWVNKGAKWGGEDEKGQGKQDQDW